MCLAFQNINNCIIDSNFTLTSLPCLEVLVNITCFAWNYFRISERPHIQVQIADTYKKPKLPTSMGESLGLAVEKKFPVFDWSLCTHFYSVAQFSHHGFALSSISCLLYASRLALK